MTIAMNLAANPLMQYAIDPLRELLLSFGTLGMLVWVVLERGPLLGTGEACGEGYATPEWAKVHYKLERESPALGTCDDFGRGLIRVDRADGNERPLRSRGLP